MSLRHISGRWNRTQEPSGVEPETLVSEPDALTTRPPPCAIFFFFFVLSYRSICIIDNGVSRRRTRKARFRDRRADHSTT